jgi:hypothetical protein
MQSRTICSGFVRLRLAEVEVRGPLGSGPGHVRASGNAHYAKKWCFFRRGPMMEERSDAGSACLRAQQHAVRCAVRPPRRKGLAAIRRKPQRRLSLRPPPGRRVASLICRKAFPIFPSTQVASSATVIVTEPFSTPLIPRYQGDDWPQGIRVAREHDRRRQDGKILVCTDHSRGGRAARRRTSSIQIHNQF